MTSSRETVSVIIPCHNEQEFLEHLLEAVRAQDHPVRETIVVDSGSTDESVAVVERYAAAHPEMAVRSLRTGAKGAAAAMNAGIRAAAGDLIVRLDGHSRPSPDYIRRAMKCLAETGAGIVGGVWQIEPGAQTMAARAIALAVASKLGSGGAAYRHGDAQREARDADTVPFGCYRRTLWESVGGYDDNLLVVEDGEFNFRVREAGYRVILDPAIRSTYFPRRRLRTLGRQYFRYGWWKIPMLMRHPRAVRIRQLIPLTFVTSLVTLAIAGAFFHTAWWLMLAILVVYAAAVTATALQVAWHGGDLRLSLPIACAFVIIHFTWGGGGLLHLVTLGRLPPWRLPARTSAP
jgi:glycosyltransferase involved in cell wall biosynthesis